MNLKTPASTRLDKLNLFIESYSQEDMTDSQFEEVAGLLKCKNSNLYSAIKMRRQGRTLKSIGDNFGVTVERARQIIFKAEHIVKIEHIKEQAKADFLVGEDVLVSDVFSDSIRILNGLRRVGIVTIGDLISMDINAIDNGVSNLGRKSIEEIKKRIEWLNEVKP